MRVVWALLAAASLAALPVAGAQLPIRLPFLSEDGGPHADDEGPAEPHAKGAKAGEGRQGAPLPVAPAPAARAAPPPSGGGALVGGTALLGVGMGALGLSLLAARRARRERTPRVKRRSAEAGQALGWGAGAASEADAFEALRSSAVGRVTDIVRAGAEVRVTLIRRRSEPCELASGYLAGLFESAWARGVVVRHGGCAGREKDATCVYVVAPAFSPGARPRAGAGTRG